MIVEVTGVSDGRTVRHRWQLLAEQGSGPFIPAIPALAIADKQDIAPGARPCIRDLQLTEIEGKMDGLPITISRSEEPSPSFFEEILRERWLQLPASVRRLHSVQDVESFSGRATVTRGSGLIARLAAWCFRFPKSGENVPLTITKYRTRTGEIWERDFAGRIFRSYLTSSRRPFHYRERFFAFTYEQELPVSDQSLHLPVRRGWFLGIPLPARLLPASESQEYAVGGIFHFDVGLYAPLRGGLIVRYR
jgi:hypothetical protein